MSVITIKMDCGQIHYASIRRLHIIFKTDTKVCYIICTNLRSQFENLYIFLNERKLVFHFGRQHDITPASATTIFILESENQHQNFLYNFYKLVISIR